MGAHLRAHRPPLGGDEVLFSFDQKTRSYVPVHVEHADRVVDIALIRLATREHKFLSLHYGRVILGRDIISYGYLNGGVDGATVKIDYRLLKGHVSRLVSDTVPDDLSTQYLETSFPSLAGFSGAPVFDGSKLTLVGMLYGNVESSIEVFSFVDVDGSVTHKESVHRIVELGKAHTVDTLVQYLKAHESPVAGGATGLP